MKRTLVILLPVLVLAAAIIPNCSHAQTANVTYHVKIAIADAPSSDDELDAAVFIETKSFPCQ
jgi:hypothetical protein